jgi:hypothetical protein
MRGSVLLAVILPLMVWPSALAAQDAQPAPRHPGVILAPTPSQALPAVEVPRRPCFPGAYYRKAVTSTGAWQGIEGVVTLPTFVPDPARVDAKTGKVLDNPSIYLGGRCGGQEIDAGLSWEVVRLPDGTVSRERRAFRPFWRNNGWFSAPAKPEYYFYPGDKVRLGCRVTGKDKLALEVALLERGEAGVRAMAQYGGGATTATVAGDPVSSLTAEFEAKGFGPDAAQEFKRVNAIDQVGNEGKGVTPTAARVEGAVWDEVWLELAGERLPMTEGRMEDMRCPAAGHFAISPAGKPGKGGEAITISGTAK